jgi:hypothetical protein
MKKPNDESREIRKRVKALLANLSFSPENVVQAAVTTPGMFRDAAEYRKLCLFERNQAKMLFEREEATYALKMRKIGRDTGTKVTEGEISAKVAANLRMVPLIQARDRAEENEEFSKLVVDAVRVRRDCLRMISELVREEISIQTAVESNRGKVDDLRSKLRARYPGEEE